MAFSIILTSALARAGGASTGGGGAFVCRDEATGAIQSSELLDLWEGRLIQTWNIPLTNDPVDQQISKALLKLSKVDTGLFRRALQELSNIQAKAQYLPPEVSFPVPTDTLSIYSKAGCPLEGMMLYDGSFDRLNIASETYQHLTNNTNKAAAWVHETIYKLLRDLENQNDSREARKLTACLFATDDCLGTAGYVIPNNGRTYYCSNASQDFYAYVQDNAWEIRYLRLGNSIFGGLLALGWDPNAKSLALKGILNKFGYYSAHVQAIGGYQKLKLADGSNLAWLTAYDFEVAATGEISRSEDISCKLVP